MVTVCQKPIESNTRLGEVAMALRTNRSEPYRFGNKRCATSKTGRLLVQGTTMANRQAFLVSPTGNCRNRGSSQRIFATEEGTRFCGAGNGES
eukprot:gene483-10159_t